MSSPSRLVRTSFCQTPERTGVGDGSGFFKLAEPLLRRMVQRSVKADYVNLKRILEAQGSGFG
jgi:hypothetical protein